MNLRCPDCDQWFREGQEIVGTFYAYWHSIPSKRVAATTHPHEAIPETFSHRNCQEANGDEKTTDLS